MQNAENVEFYDFGEFRLDARNRLLWRGERQISLALKEFEVLLFLAENSGRVIEKAELLEAVWKNTFIEEGTLTQNISRLRKKLEATGENQKIIETLPKRGYRFLPAVTRRQTAAPVSPPVIIEKPAAERARTEQTIFPLDRSATAYRGAQSPPTTPKNQKSKIKNQKSIWLAVALAAVVFAAGLFWWRNTQASPPKSLVAANVVPFSGAAGREDAPAFSPDGKQLVYVWNGGESGAAGDVYVRLAAGGEPVRLTATAAAERYPVFSPDGATVAFVRDFGTHGEVFLIPALGGAERRVCRLFSGNYSVSFAPDGKELAVIDTADSTDKKQYAVYIVNLDTGARRRVTAPAKFVGETTPRFAPDGKSIAFVRVFEAERQDLFVAPVAAATENALPAEPRRITFDQKVIHSLAWSTDGTAIFFVSFRGSNRAALWRAPAGGGEAESVSTGGREITNLAISGDGKTIAFVENAPSNSDVWQMASAESKPQEFLASTFNELYPTFAPDDSRIVFSSNRSGKNELWAVDRAGKNPRQLTKAEFKVGRAAVSPDGARAAFEGAGNFAAGIFTVEIETGAMRQLVAPADSLNLMPAWSRDGRFVYFTSNRTGIEQIWRIAADGGEPVQVTRGGAYRACPTPDGGLFFTKSRDGIDFWQITPGGEDERPVTELAAVKNAVSWAATRDRIYFFVKESEDFYRTKFYDFAARRIKAASGGFRLPTRILYSPAISADGKQLLSTADNATAGNIMLAALEQ